MTKRKLTKERIRYENLFWVYRYIKNTHSPDIAENAFHSIKTTIMCSDKIQQDIKDDLNSYLDILEVHLKEALSIYRVK